MYANKSVITNYYSFIYFFKGQKLKNKDNYVLRRTILDLIDR